MADTIDCDQILCYENEGSECVCSDCEDKHELIPNDNTCPFFHYRFHNGQAIVPADHYSFIEQYKEVVNFFEFDPEGYLFKFIIFTLKDSVNYYELRDKGSAFVSKVLTEKTIKIPSLIQVKEEDLEKFEFRISLEHEIFSIDKNQIDYSEELLGCSSGK